ncbi:OPT superfamily oligopeptide transporter [Pseudovirgaria hyperparasitica]|uniref:OPT superfamily oligopeptide transporter n=1 Tax=Pseudovirgaria hyperparasitica TaxID=470096 RepID=A0A6A6VRV2_9PEZI|nr:OPT superfamily oligopeptide transporter [Pseudovirgaria hyperparasitica]KAF2753322.1 OPT superfamily oligopeptide transporter [Pseudovirgaria hyperparasitica]
MASVLSRFIRKRAAPVTSSSQNDGSLDPSPSIVKRNEKYDAEIGVRGNSGASDSDEKKTSPAIDPDDSEEDLPDDIKEIPLIVRKIVSLEDDPTLPTITFRYFVLAFFFVAPGAVLYQMGLYRTTSSAYPVLFVQIASHYCGLWLAKVLPAWEIRVPGTKWSFNLNPGPWSPKEHVLVTVTAASGATSNAAWSTISLAQLYFDTKIPAAACIFFMWAIVFLGYAMAALVRQLLLYDPIYVWPYSLMQTSVFETLRKSSTDSWIARKQKYVFFGAFVAVFFWQFLPEYVFPFLSSLSFLCWVAPHNEIANFIGGGIGGMGFLNLSLDWSNISTGTLTNPMIVPFWTTAVLSVAFVVNCWILIPAAKWGNLGSWKHSLMSNRIFLENGTRYPVDSLMTPDLRFNVTAYEELGPIYMGTQTIWSLFFDYASYISALTWMILFGWPQIKATLGKIRERTKSRGKETVNETYNDRLNVLMRAYKEVPLWWYLVLFLVSFTTIITILGCGYFFIPIWTFFVALFTTGLMIVPFSWLYSFSAFQVPIGSFNELLYGYMIQASSTHRHPAGASAYGSLAGDIWYRAQYMLQDQKIGHYCHVSPRAIFFSQIFGEFIGVPINYGIIQWVIKEKRDYLLGLRTDSLNQWTGQALANYYTYGVQYVLVGPKRLFAQHMYSPSPYAFLFGAGAPFVIWSLHKYVPQLKFLKLQLWNVTIFCSGMSVFYGNLSTGYISRFIVGYISMRYFLRKRFETWRRYNFLIAAALDAGFNFALLAMFVIFSSGKVVVMPNWWGNNEQSVERCFALDS